MLHLCTLNKCAKVNRFTKKSDCHLSNSPLTLSLSCLTVLLSLERRASTNVVQCPAVAEDNSKCQTVILFFKQRGFKNAVQHPELTNSPSYKASLMTVESVLTNSTTLPRTTELHQCCSATSSGRGQQAMPHSAIIYKITGFQRCQTSTLLC